VWSSPKQSLGLEPMPLGIVSLLKSGKSLISASISRKPRCPGLYDIDLISNVCLAPNIQTGIENFNALPTPATS
jgi:hypothetical protein